MIPANSLMGMVARDGIEPPTPAFSGLRSATVILLIQHCLALSVALVPVRFIGTIMEPNKIRLAGFASIPFTRLFYGEVCVTVWTNWEKPRVLKRRIKTRVGESLRWSGLTKGN